LELNDRTSPTSRAACEASRAHVPVDVSLHVTTPTWRTRGPLGRPRPRRPDRRLQVLKLPAPGRPAHCRRRTHRRNLVRGSGGGARRRNRDRGRQQSLPSIDRG